MTHVIDGNAAANRIQNAFRERIDDLEVAGVTPQFATALVSEESASGTNVSMKEQARDEHGIERCLQSATAIRHVLFRGPGTRRDARVRVRRRHVRGDRGVVPRW